MAAAEAVAEEVEVAMAVAEGKFLPAKRIWFLVKWFITRRGSWCNYRMKMEQRLGTQYGTLSDQNWLL
ncbi:hypothetical protein HanRHA438_Chr09g0426121 [Helianthus annuus]|nr:hypothetical protein HanHA300_Chr09g0340141 [Helianthus annuus]KAJ0544411.1 hypothetical protein HanHA89_Chr09g0361411 [Helianthus annuus]KAJ0709414.1 hypothetical protein HanLR1_Chr09g0340151 [Helianthus annuus]KAJ0890643.1 hypothetical protein HanRHA438_Chr09g0426121 [Helianthus annuus]